MITTHRQYAKKTLDDISDYFLEQHAFLQNAERKVMQSFRNHYMHLENETKDKINSLEKIALDLMEKHEIIQKCVEYTPRHVLLTDKISEIKDFLSVKPISFDFTGLDENPFKFDILTPKNQDISKYCNLKLESDMASEPIFFEKGSKDISNNISISSSILRKAKGDNGKPSKKSKTSKPYNKVEKSINTTKGLNSTITIKPAGFGLELPETSKSQSYNINPMCKPVALLLSFSLRVTVSYVDGPNSIYLQSRMFFSHEKQLIALCETQGRVTLPVEDIVLGQMYLVNVLSIIEPDRQWYRGRIISKMAEDDKYNVRLVDYGRPVSGGLEAGKIYHISNQLKDEYDEGAVSFSLFNLCPQGEIKLIRRYISDFINRHKHAVFMYKFGLEETDKHIDILLIPSQQSLPQSLRTFLIYTGLCEEENVVMTKYNIKAIQLNEILSQFIKSHNMHQLVTRFREGTIGNARVVVARSPSDLAITMVEWDAEYKELMKKMKEYYTKDGHIIYNPVVGVHCAFLLEEGDETNWFRGKIEKVNVGKTETRNTGGSCVINAYDIAQIYEIDWESIKELLPLFDQSPPFVSYCSMAEIKPFKEHNYQWTQEAKMYFTELCYKKKYFRTEVVRISEDLQTVSVSLFFEDRKSDSETCVNALLVQHGYAVSMGNISQTITMQKEPTASANNSTNYKSLSKKKNARVRVDVLGITSPSEFYFKTHGKEDALPEFQQLIQVHMEEKVDDRPNQNDDIWEVGDRCVVFTKRGTASAEWYRAEITSKSTHQTYNVTLIDFNVNIYNIDYRNIERIISRNIMNAAPFIIKSHLACVAPLDDDGWKKTTIEYFEDCVRTSKQIFASIQGKYDRKNRSLPVVLWNKEINAAEALAPTINKYRNINNHLIQYGYIKQNGHFENLDKAPEFDKALEQAYSEQIQSIVEATERTNADALNESALDESWEYTVTEMETPIKRWKASIPIDKTMFSALPTYVDEEAIIYLHDLQQRQLYEKIKKTIKLKLGKEEPINEPVKYSKGQPCLARFHIDGEYYRAVILDELDGEENMYRVRFIDYGNVEDISGLELRSKVICGDIPILVNKYRLSDIGPLDEIEGWTTDVLDKIHSAVVQKPCTIIVDMSNEPDARGIIPCFIKNNDCDVIPYLLNDLKIVQKRKQLKGTPDAKELVPKPRRIVANFETEPKACCSNLFPGNDFMSGFIDAEMQPIFDLIDNEAAAIYDELNDQGVGVETLDRVHYFDDIKDDAFDPMDDEMDDTIENDSNSLPSNPYSPNNFNPSEFDTSTQFEAPVELSRTAYNGYLDMELDPKLRGFYCELVNCVTATEFFIFPKTDTHVNDQIELMAKIQSYAKRHKSSAEMDPETPCLAKFDEDNMWYRAIIEKVDRKSNKVTVLYVDFLNRAEIPITDTLRIPITLRKRPLRCIKVKLYGLTPNKRYRESDIIHRFVKAKEGKDLLYAKINRDKEKDKNNEDPLAVELFDDEKCIKLVYKEMIEEKYFKVNLTMKK